MSAIWRRWSLFWRREPLLSFAATGGILFFILAPNLPWGRETIHIDARTAAAIVERRANIEGRELSEEERDRAIEDYVREEILVREAYRNGWHLQNGRVRQRLLLAMRTALSEDVPDASTAELRAYYQANADRYRVPVSVTFSQVFFDKGPTLRDPSRVLGSLARGVDFRTLGDASWLGSTMVRQTRRQLQGTLGPSFAEVVFALDPGSWSGPIESNRGTHFVRVDERHPPELPELVAVRRFVEVDWATDRRAEIRERKMRRIRERYTILGP